RRLQRNIQIFESDRATRHREPTMKTTLVVLVLSLAGCSAAEGKATADETGDGGNDAIDGNETGDATVDHRVGMSLEDTARDSDLPTIPLQNFALGSTVHAVSSSLVGGDDGSMFSAENAFDGQMST